MLKKVKCNDQWEGDYEGYLLSDNRYSFDRKVIVYVPKGTTPSVADHGFFGLGQLINGEVTVTDGSHAKNNSTTEALENAIQAMLRESKEQELKTAKQELDAAHEKYLKLKILYNK